MLNDSNAADESSLFTQVNELLVLSALVLGVELLHFCSMHIVTTLEDVVYLDQDNAIIDNTLRRSRRRKCHDALVNRGFSHSPYSQSLEPMTALANLVLRSNRKLQFRTKATGEDLGHSLPQTFLAAMKLPMVAIWLFS